jgi:hypothetical protein
MDEGQLGAIEAGEVPVDQWPAPLAVEAERTGGGDGG